MAPSTTSLVAAASLFCAAALQPAALPRPRHSCRRVGSGIVLSFELERQQRQGPRIPRELVEEFVAEMNAGHAEELRRLAFNENEKDGVDWSVERMESVRLLTVDERALLLEEVLCSSRDQRCIAVEIPIPWPAKVSLSALPDMRQAFTEISRKAYAFIHDEAIPPEYEAQQDALNGLMRLMNSEFSYALKYYALRSELREAFSPTEQLQTARMTQLTYEGLSIEVETIELMDDGFTRGPLATSRKLWSTREAPRKVWSTSVLFDRACANPEDVESMLIDLFTPQDDEPQQTPPSQPQTQPQSQPPPDVSAAPQTPPAAESGYAVERDRVPAEVPVPWSPGRYGVNPPGNPAGWGV